MPCGRLHIIHTARHALLDRASRVILLYNQSEARNVMHKTNLRKVGGSIMLSVPPAILEQLHLQAGSTVTISLDSEKLVVESSPKPRYTLAELLAASDYSQPQPDSEREWVDSAAVGRELI